MMQLEPLRSENGQVGREASPSNQVPSAPRVQRPRWRLLGATQAEQPNLPLCPWQPSASPTLRAACATMDSSLDHSRSRSPSRSRHSRSPSMDRRRSHDRDGASRSPARNGGYQSRSRSRSRGRSTSRTPDRSLSRDRSDSRSRSRSRSGSPQIKSTKASHPRSAGRAQPSRPIG